AFCRVVPLVRSSGGAPPSRIAILIGAFATTPAAADLPCPDQNPIPSRPADQERAPNAINRLRGPVSRPCAPPNGKMPPDPGGRFSKFGLGAAMPATHRGRSISGPDQQLRLGARPLTSPDVGQCEEGDSNPMPPPARPGFFRSLRPLASGDDRLTG